MPCLSYDLAVNKSAEISAKIGIEALEVIMIPKFDEKKAAQVAGMLLKLRQQDGRMSYMKLIKLMYLIDREALVRWGWSMIGDSYVSMNHGQVLSATYDLIRENVFGRHTYWKDFISAPFADKQVKLVKEPEVSEISKADRGLIEEMYQKFGHWDRWRLAAYTHELPEYRKTEGPSLPVGYADVMRAENIPDERIEQILNELQNFALLQRLA